MSEVRAPRPRIILHLLAAVAVLVCGGLICLDNLAQLDAPPEFLSRWGIVGARPLAGYRSMVTVLLAAALGWLVTPVVIGLAFRLKVLDVPDARKHHGHPTPLMGGLAIYLAFLLTVFWSVGIWGRASPAAARQMRDFMMACGIVMLLGLADDIWGVSAVLRLLGQMAASGLVIRNGIIFAFLPDTWWGHAGEVILTIIWIVGIINAVNFIDGMDGLASGLTAICLYFFGYVAWKTGDLAAPIGILIAALFGACLGFFKHNFLPARIFLGDAGSTLLGFSLAVIAVMGTYSQSDNVAGLFIPLLILSIVIYDVIFITIDRIRTGVVTNVREWIEYTGRDHLHHRLHNLGLNKTETVLFIYVLALFMGTGAMVLLEEERVDKFLIVVMAATMLLVISVLMELGRKAVARNAEDEEDEGDDAPEPPRPDSGLPEAPSSG